MCQAATPTIANASSNRTVIEEVTGWLRIYSDGTVERLTPPGGEPFTAIVPPYAEPRDGVTVHDIPTGRGVDVRLYLPETAPHRRRPVLVHLHGGGFCISRTSWALYHNFYAPLAAKLRVPIVAVYLPLAPEHRLPAAIDAGHDALLWLRDVARGQSTYGSEQAAAVGRLRTAGDFSRVFLIGDSSGGNLVHLVAARAGEDSPRALRPVRLAGGVLLHPGFAREKKSRSELDNPPSLFLTQEMIDKLLILGVPLGDNKDSPFTNPEMAAKAVEHLRMPPMLLMVAEQDLLRD
ncbi:hypothetical protein EJB05_52706, partial [Eragrostis curvula]